MSGAGIALKGISKSYRMPDRSGRKLALDKVSLVIRAGEFVCLLGPSGCGKTTLLNIVGRLDEEYEGTLQFMPRPGLLTDRKSGPTIGYVFQEARLLPWMTVRDNVRLVIEGDVDTAESVVLANEWLDRVGLRGYEDYYPGQLSVGMQQRVALARALIIEPDILLMDEPLSSLDELTALHMRDEITELWRGTGCTVLFVTHNPLEAAYLADRVVVMASSPGHIVGELDIATKFPRPRKPDDPLIWTLSREAVGLLSGGYRRGDDTKGLRSE